MSDEENSQEMPNILTNIDINSDGDSDVPELTAAEIIQLMEEAWTNEKFAPEVLPHKNDIVECILGQITTMEENLESLDSTDFTKSLYQLEVDRLRYLISSYLRQRLEKIEMFCSAILQQEETRLEQDQDLYLTESELQFAREYKENLEHHFEGVLESLQELTPADWKREKIEPNMYSFVFLKSKTEIPGIVIDGGSQDDQGDYVDFTPGSQVIISYNSISNLVKRGDVKLI